MKKFLRALAITSAIVSAVSTVVLIYVYFEDSLTRVKTLSDKVMSLLNRKKNNAIVEEGVEWLD